MANKIPNIDEPQMTTGPLSWLRPWLGNMRLWARTRDPQSSTIGDPLDKFVSRRELVDLGLMIRDLDGSFGSGLGTGAQAILLSDEAYASGAHDVLSFTLLPRGNPVLFIASAKYEESVGGFVSGTARIMMDGTRVAACRRVVARASGVHRAAGVPYEACPARRPRCRGGHRTRARPAHRPHQC